ncbi:MAG TPA: AMP-binding protein [Usitatibacter sp.]|nr:AMP-binding protein [Usitatibacter sp.]
MSSVPLRSAAASRHRLVGHAAGDSVLAWRRGKPVTAAQFLADVASAAAALPDASHVLNAFSDRYRFAVALMAAVTRGQATMLPPTTTPHVVRAMRAFAPDVYAVSDDPAGIHDLPRCALPEPGATAAAGFDVPEIPGDQLVACVFTSGSTGEPQPHFKTFGGLVRDVAGEAARLAIGPGHTVLGTVPPQHMYGFESTVLMPILSGATLNAERLYYPADIEAALEATPAPRILFTTPFHLRSWMDSEPSARVETIVSATAPLSVGLARTAEQRTGARLLEIYGCTEAGQLATRRPSESPEWHALDGIRLWSEGTQAWCAGAHVDVPTPLQDVIEVRGDGSRFLLHGRAADMVNIAGKRNSIGYLDHQLTAIEGVVDGAFFLPDDEEVDGVTRLMAFVVAPTLDVAAIQAALRERIDAAFMPRPLVKVDKLPRQLTGKLPRESLRALAQEARAKQAPRKP